MYSDSFRAGLIALLMYDKTVLSSLAPDIKPRYFDNKIEQHVVRAILEHYREHSRVPKRTVVLERVLRYLDTNKANKLTGEDIASYLDESKAALKEIQDNTDFIRAGAMKFCKQMAIREAILEAAEILEKGVDNELDKIQKIITDATRVGSHGALNNGLFLLEEAAKDDSEIDKPRKIVPTGKHWIDRHCKGGPAKEELWLIAAPPNTGKTMGLVDIGCGMMKTGHKGVHFTCEMTKAQISQLYRKNLTKRSDLDLERLSEDQRQAMHRWMVRLKARLKTDVNIVEFPPSRLSPEGIVSYLTALESQHGFIPEWIIVDYLDILERPKHIRDDHLQREWLTLEVRAIAKEMKLLVWSASQVNATGTEKATAMMTDIAGAFSKNMHADGIIGFNQTVKEQEDDMLRTFWMKNRAGRKFMTDTLVTNFDQARLEMP